MTKELQTTLESLSQTREFREDILPALVIMKAESLEVLATDHEEKITAFLRGRISVLTELITLEDNLKKRQVAVSVREKTISTTRPSGALVYMDTGA